MNRTTATRTGRRNRPATKSRLKPRLLSAQEIFPEQPDAAERREMRASRWYGEYSPDRGWPPEDRPA